MREELRDYKRGRIVEEATLLFYERGYEATSVEALAARLQVTKPFIYSYFPSKLAILEAVYERSTERLVASIRAELGRKGSPSDRLRRFIMEFVKENIEHQISTTIFLQEEKKLPPARLVHIRNLQGEFDKLLAELIQAGVNAGEFRVHDVKLASLSISGMVRWVHRWYQPTGRMKATDIAEGMAVLGLNLVGCADAKQQGTEKRPTRRQTSKRKARTPSGTPPRPSRSS